MGDTFAPIIWGARPEALDDWTTLPKEVVFCETSRSDIMRPSVTHWIEDVAAWAATAGVSVSWEHLIGDRKPNHMFHDLLVDGSRVLWSISEAGNIYQPHEWDMTLVTMPMACHEHNPRLCPFPTPGWGTWAEYVECRDAVKTGWGILARMRHSADRLGLTRRRQQMSQHLYSRFRNRAMVGIVSRVRFLRELAMAGVVVHTGGAFANAFDRTAAMAFSLGKVVVQPEIHVLVGPTRPIAGYHYLACRDDMTDVGDLVQWALDYPDMADVIGKRAEQFYQENLTPTATWRRVAYWLAAFTSMRAEG